MAKTRWALLAVCAVFCLVVGTTCAQDDDHVKKDAPSPGQRFDEMEKVVNHDPLTGELTKSEFIDAIKATNAEVAEHAAEFYGRIKKADRTKVTKDEFVKAVKHLTSDHEKKQ